MAHVLVVGTDESRARDYHLLLATMGHRLGAWTDNAGDAAAYCRRVRPDLIIIDAEQVEAAAALLRQRIPVVLIGVGERAGLEAGAAAVLPKPVRPWPFVETLEGLLEDTRQRSRSTDG
jgi:CheY-like chemotaxis protein